VTLTAVVLRLYVLTVLSLRIVSTKPSSTLVLLNLHEPVPIVPHEHGASIHWDSSSISVSFIKTKDIRLAVPYVYKYKGRCDRQYCALGSCGTGWQ